MHLQEHILKSSLFQTTEDLAPKIPRRPNQVRCHDSDAPSVPKTLKIKKIKSSRKKLISDLLLFQVSMFSKYSLCSYVVGPTKKLNYLVNLWQKSENLNLEDNMYNYLTNSLLCQWYPVHHPLCLCFLHRGESFLQL